MPLFEVLENELLDDNGEYLCPSIDELKKFFKTQYFFKDFNNDYSPLPLLDSLKIIWFLIIFSHDTDDSKISVFIEAILEEIKGNKYSLNDISDNEYVSDNAQGVKFYRKHPQLLEVLSFLLAGVILPFVYYFKDKFLEDKNFIEFKKYATTNSNIFFDFARYTGILICIYFRILSFDTLSKYIW